MSLLSISAAKAASKPADVIDRDGVSASNDQPVHVSHFFPDRPRHLPWIVEFTGLTKQSIYRLMRLNRFPRPIRLGMRKVAWMESDVVAWLKSRQQA